MSRQLIDEVPIPKETAIMIHERVKGLIESHLEDEKLQNTVTLNMPVRPRHDLKWLAISSYLQGLMDAQQLEQDHKG